MMDNHWALTAVKESPPTLTNSSSRFNGSGSKTNLLSFTFDIHFALPLKRRKTHLKENGEIFQLNKKIVAAFKTQRIL